MIKIKKGFTLVELIVVVAIIAILTAVIAPNIINAVRKTNVAKSVSDFKALKKAWITLYTDVGIFPVTSAANPDYLEDMPMINNTHLVKKDAFNFTLSGWNGPYIENIRENPWGAPYRYYNDRVCWTPTHPNCWVGVRITWRRDETALDEKEFEAVTYQTDAFLDSDADDTGGIFCRYNEVWLAYLINDGC